jgi:putative tricarboxylic transport membrane protein
MATIAASGPKQKGSSMTSGRSLRLGEGVLSLGVLALGLFIAAQTTLLEVGPSQAAVGPRLFPFMIAIGLIAVGLSLLREAFFGHIAHERGWELDWRAVILVTAGLVAQMLLLESLGWIVATTLLFLATTFAFGSRQALLGIVYGLALSAFVFVSFNYGLGLDLPTGAVIEQLLAPASDEAP